MVSVEKVYYPAYAIQDSEGGYKAYLPDFGNDCIASSNNLQETVKGAREALHTCIFKHAQQGNKLPKPYTGTPLTTGLLVEIDVWLEPIIDRANMQAVNKNTTAPRWLIRLAEEKGINFSEVLQAALKQELGITNYIPRAIFDDEDSKGE